ncbi:hypothetical protein [Actinoplanes auranticolor]|uniref:Uncharacterized protein n=1 Tax=Actinoplanes auranticolor TaxID=47988 RepID=A0A919SDQ8_9ACTN|nr:hypothetical protein [Actinoplanes auranticolor]GIM69797.1 hypothetical protein Aau02nite_37770 [Actinoplanes auranticolor]
MADDPVGRAVELDDLDQLRRLAASGSADAVEALVEIAGERADVAELRRLAEAGSRHAAEVLADLTDD